MNVDPGMEAANPDPFRQHRFRPLGEHVSDWARFLESKEREPRHYRLEVGRARSVIDRAGLAVVGDIRASAVIDAIAGIRADSRTRDGPGMGIQTANFHLDAMKAFTCFWPKRDRRIGEDPLAYLEPEKVTDVTKRRAPTWEEAVKLLDAASASGRVFRGLTGKDRQALYLTACKPG